MHKSHYYAFLKKITQIYKKNISVDSDTIFQKKKINNECRKNEAKKQ